MSGCYNGASDVMALLGGGGNPMAAAVRQAQLDYGNALAANCPPIGPPACGQPCVLGIDSEPQAAGGIAGAATLVILTRVNVPFEVCLFQTTPSQAANFLVNDIKSGRTSLFAGGDPAPAEMFLAGPNGSGGLVLATEVLAAGTQLSTSVTNIDAAAHRFNAGIRGRDVTMRY